MKKQHIAILAALPFFQLTALANDAAFTPDGKFVYVIGRWESSMLFKIDVESGKAEKIQLTGVPGEGGANAITVAPDGRVLIACEGSVYDCTAKGKAPKLVAKQAEFYIHDICVAPQDTKAPEGALLVSGFYMGENAAHHPFLILSKGGKTLGDVFCRRVNAAGTAAFASDGRFFFAADSDLWVGSIDASEAEEEEAAQAILTGHRVAPLAYANTDMANSGAMRVAAIAPANDYLYVHLGGRHMGALLRIPTPKAAGAGEEGEHPALGEYYKEMSNSLKGVEVLSEDEIFGLTSSPDGTNIFYRVSSTDEDGALNYMLITDDDEPKKIGTEARE